MVPRSTIYKQKKFFTFVSILSCLLLLPPTFSKMMLKCLKSSSSSQSNWKKQQSYIRLSVQFRRQGGKLRQKQEKKLEGGRLWKRRSRRKEYWSTSNNFEKKDAALLEDAEGSQIIGSKCKKAPLENDADCQPSKKAKEKQPARY